jgi:predicted HTH domain antitoxin
MTKEELGSEEAVYRGVQEWKKEYAAKLYAEGKVTLERAAMEAGVSVREMMDYLKEKKVPAQYSLEDLKADLKRLYRKLGRIS